MIQVSDTIRCNVNGNDMTKRYIVLHIDLNVNGFLYSAAYMIDISLLSGVELGKFVDEFDCVFFNDDRIFYDYLDRYELDIKTTRLNKIKRLLND